MSSTDAELAVVTFTFARLRAESSANSLPSFGRTTRTLRSIESAEITFANSAVLGAVKSSVSTAINLLSKLI